MRILEINEKSASAGADEIAGSGDSASFHSCDVTDKLLSHIARRGRIHILVNNAGISHVGSVETNRFAFTRSPSSGSAIPRDLLLCGATFNLDEIPAQMRLHQYSQDSFHRCRS